MTHVFSFLLLLLLCGQGGLMGGQITEIVGTSGKGKTQVRHRPLGFRHAARDTVGVRFFVLTLCCALLPPVLSAHRLPCCCTW
jgi:RecA/RadA recombinase